MLLLAILVIKLSGCVPVNSAHDRLMEANMSSSLKDKRKRHAADMAEFRKRDRDKGIVEIGLRAPDKYRKQLRAMAAMLRENKKPSEAFAKVFPKAAKKISDKAKKMTVGRRESAAFERAIFDH
jgi:hypothetical protein